MSKSKKLEPEYKVDQLLAESDDDDDDEEFIQQILNKKATTTKAASTKSTPGMPTPGPTTTTAKPLTESFISAKSEL